MAAAERAFQGEITDLKMRGKADGYNNTVQGSDDENSTIVPKSVQGGSIVSSRNVSKNRTSVNQQRLSESQQLNEFFTNSAEEEEVKEEEQEQPKDES